MRDHPHAYWLRRFGRMTLVAMCLSASIVTACSFSFSVGSVPGEVSGDPEFGDVLLATELEPMSKEPVIVVTEFPEDVAEMFAAIHAKNVPAGSEFRFRWLKDNEQILSLKIDVPVAVRAGCTVRLNPRALCQLATITRSKCSSTTRGFQ